MKSIWSHQQLAHFQHMYWLLSVYGIIWNLLFVINKLPTKGRNRRITRIRHRKQRDGGKDRLTSTIRVRRVDTSVRTTIEYPQSQMLAEQQPLSTAGPAAPPRTCCPPPDLLWSRSALWRWSRGQPVSPSGHRIVKAGNEWILSWALREAKHRWFWCQVMFRGVLEGRFPACLC